MNHQNDTSLYNASDTTISINSDNNQQSNSPPETRNNDETSNPERTVNIDVNTTSNSDSSTVQQNFLSFLHEARTHLGGRQINIHQLDNNDHIHHHHRHQLQPQQQQQQQQHEDSNVNRWRVNLNNVLSFSAGPSTETIRSWIPRSGTFRYVPLSRASPATAVQDTPETASDEPSTTTDVIINISSAPSGIDRNENTREVRTSNGTRINITRANSMAFGDAIPIPIANSDGETNSEPGTSNSHRTPSTPPPRNPTEMDEENPFHELAVKVLSHFVRYLPFIGIVLIKSIYDNWKGILDIGFLQIMVYHLNKSVTEQAGKMSQKNLGVLFRDGLLLTFVVVYRLNIASSQPDYFGLLLNTATDPHSLGQLLFAVAINDIILKLLTIQVKIIVTALPVNVIMHKPRGRLYALIEAISQMYRSLVPVKSWLVYLLVSYNGLDIIVGMFLFCSLYMGAKAFEFLERGKFLKKAFCAFLRNVDYGRKPTKEELGDAGALCAICHDSFNAPVVLECNHIFCEVCVGTWFKREQTCPMCRAKVADDPIWQNGSTTLFYQLC